jgi:hypothetical protein
MTSWMGGPRTDLAYPRVAEDRLLAAGRPAEVRVTAAVGQRAKDALATWEREVVTWSPDVIVLHYGQYEAVHLFVPAVVERYANRVSCRPGRVRDAVHRHLVRRAYLGLVLVQRQVDAVVPARFWARRARRVAADLGRVVERVRTIGSPLVLIPDQLHPDPAWSDPFPGMAGRVDLLNDALRHLVDRFDDPEVRILPVGEIVAGLEGDAPCAPDGGHFAPHVHRAVGAGLAAVILEWSAHQPHLQRLEDPGEPAAPPSPIEPPAARPKEHVS